MTISFEEYTNKRKAAENKAKQDKVNRLDSEFHETMNEYEHTLNQMYLKYHNNGQQVPFNEIDNMLALLGSAGVQAKECREAHKE